MTRNTKDNPETYPALGRALTWVDKPGSLKKIVNSFYVLCIGLFAADLFYHKHTYLWAEDIPGFYALYGFFMCAALVVCAKGMRLFLKRPEDYYAPKDVESEPFPEEELDRVENDA